jgi:hypothetical protein
MNRKEKSANKMTEQKTENRKKNTKRNEGKNYVEEKKRKIITQKS